LSCRGGVKGCRAGEGSACYNMQSQHLCTWLIHDLLLNLLNRTANAECTVSRRSGDQLARHELLLVHVCLDKPSWYGV
jgi:hypothetical protein